jgi:hypothetical protein
METNLLKQVATGAMISVSAVSMNFIGATSAQAIDFALTTTFDNDNDVQLVDFTIDSARNITLFSSSWDDGGLDPIMGLWDANGDLIWEQDDIGSTGSIFSNGVEYDYGRWDSNFTQFLGSGSYTVSVGQYNNFANGYNLADGFRYDDPGDENFTAQFGCTQGSFCGVSGQNDNRTNSVTFHILGADSLRTVPEPGTVVGILAVGLGSAAVRRTKKSK